MAVKAKTKSAELYDTLFHSCPMSLAIWDHTVLPITRQKWTHPNITPARQLSTRFTYPGEMKAWVYPSDRVYSEMVYPPTDGHQSKH